MSFHHLRCKPCKRFTTNSANSVETLVGGSIFNRSFSSWSSTYSGTIPGYSSRIPPVLGRSANPLYRASGWLSLDRTVCRSAIHSASFQLKPVANRAASRSHFIGFTQSRGHPKKESQLFGGLICDWRSVSRSLGLSYTIWYSYQLMYPV